MRNSAAYAWKVDIDRNPSWGGYSSRTSFYGARLGYHWYHLESLQPSWGATKELQ